MRKQEYKDRMRFYNRRFLLEVADTADHYKRLLELISRAVGKKTYFLFEIREYKRKPPRCRAYYGIVPPSDYGIKECNNLAEYRLVFRNTVSGKFRQVPVCGECYEKITVGIVEKFVRDLLKVFGYAENAPQKVQEIALSIFWRHIVNSYNSEGGQRGGELLAPFAIMSGGNKNAGYR